MTTGNGTRRASLARAVAVLVAGAAVLLTGIPAASAGFGFQTQWGSQDLSAGHFFDPSAVAVDPSGNVYVADYGNNRIEKFDASGNALTTWGSLGAGAGQFQQPLGIAVNAAGTNVYVTDFGHNRVEEFTASGAFVRQWGSAGGGGGTFNGPSGIAVDPNGAVDVADQNNRVIQRFTSIGGYLTEWGTTGSVPVAGIATDASDNVYAVEQTASTVTVEKFDSTGTSLTSWGSVGTGNGQFSNTVTFGIAIDASNHVDVVDEGNNRVEQFDATGTYLTQWGTAGSGNGQFNSPTSVATGPSNVAYVVDSGGDRVEKFDASQTPPTFLLGWGSYGAPCPPLNQPNGIALTGGTVNVVDFGNSRVVRADPAGNPNTPCSYGTAGSGDGQFTFAVWIAADPAGANVYVTDLGNNRVEEFTAGGSFVRKFGTPGSGNGQLSNPNGIAVDGSGDVYVVDTGNSRIEKFDSIGNYLTQWGTSGVGNGQFSTPAAIAVDSLGNVYVTDKGNNRVEKFDTSGTYLTQWGASGSGAGQFNDPLGIAVADTVDRDVYVTDGNNNRVEQFSPTGLFLGTFGTPGTGPGQLSFPRGIAVSNSVAYVVDAGNNRVETFGVGGGLKPVTPTRILDTRIGRGAPTGPIGAQQTLNVAVTNTFSSGVPAAGVDAVLLNVTATSPSAGGWLTLFPAGTTLPTASNLNFGAGATVPNLVVVKVGHGGANEGKVSINNTGGNPGAGNVQVIADVVGWYEDGSNTTAHVAAAGYVPIPPQRILDTRNGTGAPMAPVGPNQSLTLDVATPAPPECTSATAAVLNVTATNPAQGGWLTVYPADQTLPTASNLNFATGQTVPNLVTVALGVAGPATGKITITNTDLPTLPHPPAGTVDVVADLVGCYKGQAPPTTSLLTSFAPQRILDTRSGLGVVGGAHNPVGPNATIAVDPQTATGLPAVGGYSGVIVNVTATGPTQGGWATAWPTGATLPTASNLNFTTGQTVANLVKVKVGPDGKFNLTNTDLPGGPHPPSGTVHLVVDIVGYFQ